MECLKHKPVRTRKPRICWCCGFRYRAGVKMIYNVCVDNGTIIDTYWCMLCEDFINTSQKNNGVFDFEDGIAQNEFLGEPAYEHFVFSKTYYYRQLLIEKIENLDLSHITITGP